MRTLTLIAVLASYAGASCAKPVSARPVEPAVLQATSEDSSALERPGVDLTGTWATGSGGEPADAKLTLTVECRRHPTAWVIQQTGNKLEAWTFPESYDQGIATRDHTRPRAATGRISGLDVRMSDGESRYVLRFDRRSGHLRGTKNGKPFWAVRQEVVRPPDCPAVP